MIKAAQWTSAIVGGVSTQAMAAKYVPEIIMWMIDSLSGQIALILLGLIVAYASVKIDKWRMA